MSKDMERSGRHIESGPDQAMLSVVRKQKFRGAGVQRQKAIYARNDVTGDHPPFTFLPYNFEGRARSGALKFKGSRVCNFF